MAIAASAPFLLSCGKLGSASTLPIETDVLDEALKLMRHVNPVGNHGPMAAEALVALGRSDKLKAFVPSFLNRFSRDMPSSKVLIDTSNWGEAIGDRTRITDWKTFFEKEVFKNDWKQVVDQWSVILAPGLRGAATHGVIRTGHAVRSLQAKGKQG